MLFRDISYDMIICTSSEILHAYLQQIKLFAVFQIANFLHISQLQVPVPELGINSSKSYRKFKSLLVSLLTVNNGGNKLFRMCKSIFSKGIVEPNIVKIKGQNFTGVYPSPVLMNLDARKCIILSCLFIRT